jgi:hypothetical protein
VSKEYLNKSLTNYSARTVLFDIYPRSIDKVSLLKRNDHVFDYFKLIFVSQLLTDLVIIFFRCDHEPIFLIFENSLTYYVRNDLFAVDFGIN